MIECHGLDTPTQVFFYEQDFYVLSNFSAFSIQRMMSIREGTIRFDTAEHLYHYLKFKSDNPSTDQLAVMNLIRYAPSAHRAFVLGQERKDLRRSDWDDIKVSIMLGILRDKCNQHEYVKRKLLQTGDRELIENSWRDDFWGWGPNKDGLNMLGKLWMQVREGYRTDKPQECAIY